MTRPVRELRRRGRLTGPGSDLRHAITARQGQTARDTSLAPDRRAPPGMEPRPAAGGGSSSVFPWPAYRVGVTGAETRRGVPDVGPDASPGTDMAVAFYEDRRQITGFANGTSAGPGRLGQPRHRS